MWTRRIRVLLTISLVASVKAQGYGNLDDDSGSSNPQFGGHGQTQPQQQIPQNQQISSLPQYDSVEQGPAGGSGIYLQQQQQPQQQSRGVPWWQGQNAFQRPPGHPGVEQLAPPAQQPNPPYNGAPGSQNIFQRPPGHPGVVQLAPPAQQPNPPYNGAPGSQNIFQRPPGHPGVEQLAPPAQQPNPPYNGAPSPQNFNPQGNGQPPIQTTQRPYAVPTPPPRPQTTQQPYTNPPPPPPLPPQQPNVQQVTNPPPVPQYTPDPGQYNPPPPPPPPQQPAQVELGWNAPPQQQLPPSQNYYPQGQGTGQPEEIPGCDLVNKADCHNNRRNFNIPSSASPSPPSQNYQPPPQYQQQPQQPYEQPQQPYDPVEVPNQGYQPPPPQSNNGPQTSRPYQPSQSNPYQQNNQQSSQNFQPQQQQKQRPYTPPQTPRPQRQQNQQPQEPAVPYPGCPAAMLCVQDEYCNSIGLIEENPIQFSAADRLHRVALMACSEPMTGVVGVCCRDPNYKDPWPDMKKDSAAHHHHPANKGQSQGQNFQPPQGNHLQSGNPYSGPTGDGNNNRNPYNYNNNNNGSPGWIRNRNNVQCADNNKNYNTNNYPGKLVVSNDHHTATTGSRIAATATTTSPSYFNPNNKKTSKSIKLADSSSLPVHLPSYAPTNLLSESKQMLQVLEPCSSDELCLSMSQCHSLNPQFMAKTGLNSASAKRIASGSTVLHGDNFTTGLVQVKRCKYERSGIHYLCCKRPAAAGHTSSSPLPIPTSTSPFQFTPSRFTFRHTTTTTTTTTPRALPLSTFKPSSPSSFTFPLALGPIPTASPTTKSSLITGVGLRFHSGLHTAKQQEINSRKPNPYREDEEPIQLISPKEESLIMGTTTPFSQFANDARFNHQFNRFTTTSRTPITPKTISEPFSTTVLEPKFNQQLHHHTKEQNNFSLSTVPTTHESFQALARIIGTSRTYFSTTTPIPSRSGNDPTFSSSSSSTGQLVSSSSFIPSSTTPFTTIPTTPEGKVDISKIPSPVPLRPEIKAEPPVGFIFKGDDLYIPEVQMPAQNFLLPANEFEERSFPTEPPYEQVDQGTATTVGESEGGGEVQDGAHNEQSSSKKQHTFNKNPFLHNNSIEGTTIYSILDGSQETAG